MSAFKALADNWLPPAIVRWTHRWQGGAIRFEGEFATWDEAAAQCTGYDTEEILAKVLAATIKVKNGEAAFERDSVLFDKIEYAWSVLSGLLWAASCDRGRLNVLDFGGALGSSYFQNRRFLRALPEVRWNVVEQAHYVKAGIANIQGEQLRFYDSIEQCLGESQPNVILLSSVLQYLSDPIMILDELIAVKADTVVFDSTIINHSGANRVYIQHVPPSIYSASYPCRSFSERSLIKLMGRSYRLVADFPSLPFPTLQSIDSEFKGYLFKKIC